MLKRINCLLARHTVNRKRVWHDGLDFRTRCAACGTQLVRIDGKGWQVFGQEYEADDRRMAKSEVDGQHA